MSVVSGTIYGRPIKLIGVCDIPGYPYVIQWHTAQGALAIQCFNSMGQARDGLLIPDFTDNSEFVEDI